MPRIHAPEIEDEAWCPRVIRDGLTGFLQTSSEVLGVYDGATALVADVVMRHHATRLVDLCSGGGGPMLRLRSALKAKHHVDVDAVLTDLYPNLGAFTNAEARSAGGVVGVREPVDASDVPASLVGVRTIFNGFHHFRPELARSVVVDAARKRQPFISVEVVDRRFITVLVLMATPLAAVLLLPWSRPFTLARAFFTWVVPLVPLGIWWDGMMSCLRSYSPDELRALTSDLNTSDYAFRIEHIAVPRLPLRLTALVGEPTSPVTSSI
jgi:hypothetical protein